MAQTRSLLRRSHLRARKGLGQHFLVDEGVLGMIVAAAELNPGDVVIEVGPGLGVLTLEMANRAGRMVAVELDNNLAALMKKTLAHLGNVTVINEDILKVDPLALLLRAGVPPPANRGYKVVANLPYYITAPVLRHFLEASVKPGAMVVMVQWEVAEAITAPPGRMSLLSVSVQYYGNPRIISRVPAGCFYPVPQVDSALLRIDLYPQPAVAVADESSFFALVRAGFTTPRKQLANSLAQGLGLPKAAVLPLLEEADIFPRRRAESLALGEWARMWQVWRHAGDSGTG